MLENFFGNNNKEDRIRAAQQICSTRGDEKDRRGIPTNFKVNRDAYEYFEELGGIKKLLEYLKILKITKILDIGSGTGRAINEISNSDLGQGFEFVGTSLFKYPDEDAKKIHLTSAEVLRGIPASSFGAVLSVCGVGYSDAPNLVAEQINRVLVPGGVFKGSFADERPVTYGSSTLKRYDDLRLALQKKGYDTAIVPDFLDVPSREKEDTILLAIKSNPSLVLPHAVDLLMEDYEKFFPNCYKKFIPRRNK